MMRYGKLKKKFQVNIVKYRNGIIVKRQVKKNTLFGFETIIKIIWGYMGFIEDERYMREALKEAKKAFNEEEVPVGVVIVFENKIIARGYNQVETLKDATAHAEVLSIGAASAYVDNWRLIDCTLYSTLEPCIMCMGAIILSRISRVVWGANDLRHGANGSFINVLENKHPIHNPEIVSGVLKEECEMLMKSFFKKIRNGG